MPSRDNGDKLQVKLAESVKAEVAEAQDIVSRNLRYLLAAEVTRTHVPIL